VLFAKIGVFMSCYTQDLDSLYNIQYIKIGVFFVSCMYRFDKIDLSKVLCAKIGVFFV
jgi:hypothetical protein